MSEREKDEDLTRSLKAQYNKLLDSTDWPVSMSASIAGTFRHTHLTVVRDQLVELN